MRLSKPQAYDGIKPIVGHHGKPIRCTPLDGCPVCGDEVFIGHGSYGATYATCRICGWQDVLTQGDPSFYEPVSLGADAPDDPPGELFSRYAEFNESRKEEV